MNYLLVTVDNITFIKNQFKLLEIEKKVNSEKKMIK